MPQIQVQPVAMPNLPWQWWSGQLHTGVDHLQETAQCRGIKPQQSARLCQQLRAGMRVESNVPPTQMYQLEQVECLHSNDHLAMQLQPALGSPTAGPPLPPARLEARAGLGILQRLPPLLDGCMGC